jgi:hypothetical protein
MDGREADNELKRRVSKGPVMKRGSRRARENQDENNKSAERTDRQPTTNTDHSRRDRQDNAPEGRQDGEEARMDAGARVGGWARRAGAAGGACY